MGARFKASYALVKPTEELMAEFYRWMGFDTILNNDYRYDLLLKKGGKSITTIEIKEQFRIEKWKTALLEYMCRQKPSGITTSWAEYWIEVLHFGNNVRYYIAKTEDIRELIKDERYEDKIEGGDDKQSLLYRFKIDEYLKVFKPLNKLYEYKKIKGV